MLELTNTSTQHLINSWNHQPLEIWRNTVPIFVTWFDRVFADEECLYVAWSILQLVKHQQQGLVSNVDISCLCRSFYCRIKRITKKWTLLRSYRWRETTRIGFFILLLISCCEILTQVYFQVRKQSDLGFRKKKQSKQWKCSEKGSRFDLIAFFSPCLTIKVTMCCFLVILLLTLFVVSVCV